LVRAKVRDFIHSDWGNLPEREVLGVALLSGALKWGIADWRGHLTSLPLSLGCWPRRSGKLFPRFGSQNQKEYEPREHQGSKANELDASQFRPRHGDENLRCRQGLEVPRRLFFGLGSRLTSRAAGDYENLAAQVDAGGAGKR
jgi:hypothetical protein